MLRGLFEADGMVVDGVPSVATASRTFAAELRTLLLSMGLATTTREMVSGFGGLVFQVRLRNVDHALRFDERVGFLGVRKNELVVELDSAQAGTRDRIVLPRPVWDAVLAKAPEYRSKVLPSLRRLGGVPRQTAEQMFRSAVSRGWRTRSGTCSSAWPATPMAECSRRTTSRCRTTSPTWHPAS